jgi:hypothetical protein
LHVSSPEIEEAKREMCSPLTFTTTFDEDEEEEAKAKRRHGTTALIDWTLTLSTSRL